MNFLLIELAERLLLEEQMTETKNDQQGATLELIGTMRSKVRSATFSRPYVESSGVFCRRVVERLQPFYGLLFFSRCRFFVWPSALESEAILNTMGTFYCDSSLIP